MGAQESRAGDTQGDEPVQASSVQDYYAILQVSESADQDEIKASSFASTITRSHSLMCSQDRRRFESKL